MALRRIPVPVRWALFAVGALALAAGSVWAYRMSRPAVTVTDAIEGPVVEAFYATGTLQPEREHPVKAIATGVVQKPPPAAVALWWLRRSAANLPFKYTPFPEPYVDKGHAVGVDQPLAVIADAQWQAALDKARAEVEEKRRRADDRTSPVLQEFDAKVSATGDQLEIARREEARVVQLRQSSGSSQGELDQAINRVKGLWMETESHKAQKQSMKLQLQRELESAEAALRAAEWNVELQTLRSPVDGVVLDRPVPQGTRLGVNDHVMQIADVRPANLVMRAQVDEEDITHVRVGQTVRMVFYAYADRPAFEGRVVKIYDKADPDRRTFEVDVKPARPEETFRAGMTGELAFEVQSKPSALVIPSQAVQDGKVFVLRDGRLRAVEPDVGLKGVEKTEILSGVNPGDRVLISPAAGLSDGQSVRAQYMDPIAAAALNKPKAKEVFRGGF